MFGRQDAGQDGRRRALGGRHEGDISTDDDTQLCRVTQRRSSAVLHRHAQQEVVEDNMADVGGEREGAARRVDGERFATISGDDAVGELGERGRVEVDGSQVRDDVADRCEARHADGLVAPQRAGEQRPVIVHVQHADSDGGSRAATDRTAAGTLSRNYKTVTGKTFVVERLMRRDVAGLGVHVQRQLTADVAFNDGRDRVDDAVVGRLVAVDRHDAADEEPGRLVLGDPEVVAIALEARRFVVDVVDEDANVHRRRARLDAAIPRHHVELDGQIVRRRQRFAVDLGTRKDLSGVGADQHQPLRRATGSHLQSVLQLAVGPGVAVGRRHDADRAADRAVLVDAELVDDSRERRRVVVGIADAHPHDGVGRERRRTAVDARDGDVMAVLPLAVELRRRRSDQLELGVGERLLAQREHIVSGCRRCHGAPEMAVHARVGVGDGDVGDERSGRRVFSHFRHPVGRQRVDADRRRIVVDVFDVDDDGGVDGDRVWTAVDGRDGEQMNTGLFVVERRRRLNVDLAGVGLDAEQVAVALLGPRREGVNDGAVHVDVAVASAHSGDHRPRRRVLQNTNLPHKTETVFLRVSKGRVVYAESISVLSETF